MCALTCMTGTTYVYKQAFSYVCIFAHSDATQFGKHDAKIPLMYLFIYTLTLYLVSSFLFHDIVQCSA